MVLKALLTVVSVAGMITTLLIPYHRRLANNVLFRSFERNFNGSMCVFCLGNDSSCSALDFQLDYKLHADLGLHSNYLSKFILIMIRIMNLWTNHQNDRIFFGTLKLNNQTEVRAVAKSPGQYYSEMFEQAVHNFSDIGTVISDNKWTLIPLNEDKQNLDICSNDDTESYLLLQNFFNSVISVESLNRSQSLLEVWTAAHLSVELLVLKILDGYRYAPNVYGTCGRVYFVEDCGHTLQYHLNDMNLSNRLFVIKELLKLALELSDGSAHSNYSIYLTDLTPENIAVQLNETSGLIISLKVIDWSDVIIVSNDHCILTDDSNTHVSENIDCGLGCLTYSKEDICRASISDHNVYAVCKEFLSIEGGLYFKIKNQYDSNKIQEKLIKEVEIMVKHCLQQTDVEQRFESRYRLDTAKLIISTIESIFI